MESLTIFAPMLGIFGLVIAGLIYAYVRNQSPGNELMMEISDAIHEGAMVFLRREYTYLVVFIAIVFVGLAVFINKWTAVAFLAGALCSMLAGYFGMEAATRANVRTSAAANLHGQSRNWPSYG